jgi:Transposase DDE domain group 1
VFAICCGHEDAIDHDRLRDDPLLKIAVGRCPDSGAALASQSTITRFENAPTKTDALRLGHALIDWSAKHVSQSFRDIFDIVMLKACSPPARHLLCGLRRPAIGVLECAS